MPNIRNTFVGGKMDLDTDERLIKKGTYGEANNIQVINSNGSDVGAIEKTRGNELLLDLNLTEGKCIGSLSDDSNQKVYYFLTSIDTDLIVEYDFKKIENEDDDDDPYTLVLKSDNGILNFSKEHLIGGVVKIINEDKNKDLLVWTDNLNPPRIINIERAKGYSINGFTEDDISLIKKPPVSAPNVSYATNLEVSKESLQDKFIAFAYRYVYLDNEYSALSAFSYYAFEAGTLDIDYDTSENEGMSNQFNAYAVSMNTGSKNVKAIELVYKESNSNTVYIVERFEKSILALPDDQEDGFVFSFSNTKLYTVLPEDEILRTYDNVPLRAKTLAFVGNRLVFGNYEEGYDLVDDAGDEIKIDFLPKIKSIEVIDESIQAEITPIAISEITTSYYFKPLSGSFKYYFENIDLSTFDLSNSTIRNDIGVENIQNIEFVENISFTSQPSGEIKSFTGTIIQASNLIDKINQVIDSVYVEYSEKFTISSNTDLTNKLIINIDQKFVDNQIGQVIFNSLSEFYYILNNATTYDYYVGEGIIRDYTQFLNYESASLQVVYDDEILTKNQGIKYYRIDSATGKVEYYTYTTDDLTEIHYSSATINRNSLTANVNSILYGGIFDAFPIQVDGDIFTSNLDILGYVTLNGIDFSYYVDLSNTTPNEYVNDKIALGGSSISSITDNTVLVDVLSDGNAVYYFPFEDYTELPFISANLTDQNSGLSTTLISIEFVTIYDPALEEPFTGTAITAPNITTYTSPGTFLTWGAEYFISFVNEEKESIITESEYFPFDAFGEFPFFNRITGQTNFIPWEGTRVAAKNVFPSHYVPTIGVLTLINEFDEIDIKFQLNTFVQGNKIVADSFIFDQSELPDPIEQDKYLPVNGRSTSVTFQTEPGKKIDVNNFEFIDNELYDYQNKTTRIGWSEVEDYNVLATKVQGKQIYPDVFNPRGDTYVPNEANELNIVPVNLKVFFNNIEGTESIPSYETYEFPKGSSVVFNFELQTFDVSEEYVGNYLAELVFDVNENYADGEELFQSSEFSDFIENDLKISFKSLQTSEVPIDADISQTTIEGFNVSINKTAVIPGVSESGITGPNSNCLGRQASISAPKIIYRNTSGDIILKVEWNYSETISLNLVKLENQGGQRSIKSIRDYELGIVYLDEYNRSTTVLTDTDNNISVLPINLTNQNRFEIDVFNKAPKFAKRYKFAVKSITQPYFNIFAFVFFVDIDFVWVKLEGADKDKVKEGDVLYVKSDSTGAINTLKEVRVLEAGPKETNFIALNKTDANSGGTPGEDIIEPSGFYIKLKEDSFTASYSPNTFFNKQWHDNRDSERPRVYVSIPKKGQNGEISAIYKNAKIRLKLYSHTERTGKLIDYALTYRAEKDYDTFQDFFEDKIGYGSIPIPIANVGDQNTNNDRPDLVKIYTRKSNSNVYFESPLTGGGNKRRTSDITITITIRNPIRFTSENDEKTIASSDLVFETRPALLDSDVFYETSEVFDIVDGKHMGNVQDQTDTESAIVELDWFNCYVMGGGVESISYLDNFNTNYLSTDLRPTASLIEKYSSQKRFADLTYSEPYNDSNNYNGLNEFNLSRINYKDDIDKADGQINFLLARDNNVILFQDDKISYVLVNKSMLTTANGKENLTQSNLFLNQQVPYGGNFGCIHPQSIASNGFNVFWVDAKRGTVLRLSNSGIDEIRMGLRNYLRENIKENFSDPIQGGYDENTDQYFVTINNRTISYLDTIKGWTSFHSFVPDNMIGINNEFLSFKDGVLYLHNSENVDINNLYGNPQKSSIVTTFNEVSNQDKIFKTIFLESQNPWKAFLKTNLTQSTINKDEFNKRESKWFSYTRGNEDSEELNGVTQGIGIIQSTELLEDLEGPIFFTSVDSLVNVGDELFQVNNNVIELIGVIDEKTATSVVINTIINIPIVGNFCFSKKDSRIQGDSMRGYYLSVTIECESNVQNEIFAVNSNAVKSSF